MRTIKHDENTDKRLKIGITDNTYNEIYERLKMASSSDISDKDYERMVVSMISYIQHKEKALIS